MGTVVVNSKTKQHGQGHHFYCPRGCFLCPSCPSWPTRLWPTPTCIQTCPLQRRKTPTSTFAYQYGVKDDYSGASYQKSETQDQYGVVGGSYTVALPDGRTQIVTYTADHEGGFIADVKYEGVAQYPPEPKEGYGHAPPAYHPAPPPKYAPAPAKRQ